MSSVTWTSTWSAPSDAASARRPGADRLRRTSAPCAAAALTVARPMPLVPPTTTTRWPDSVTARPRGWLCPGPVVRSAHRLPHPHDPTSRASRSAGRARRPRAATPRYGKSLPKPAPTVNAWIRLPPRASAYVQSRSSWAAAKPFLRPHAPAGREVPEEPAPPAWQPRRCKESVNQLREHIEADAPLRWFPERCRHLPPHSTPARPARRRDAARPPQLHRKRPAPTDTVMETASRRRNRGAGPRTMHPPQTRECPARSRRTRLSRRSARELAGAGRASRRPFLEEKTQRREPGAGRWPGAVRCCGLPPSPTRPNPPLHPEPHARAGTPPRRS